MKRKFNWRILSAIFITTFVICVLIALGIWRKPLYNLFSRLTPTKTTSEVFKQFKPDADASEALKNIPSDYEEIKIDEKNSVVLESRYLDFQRVSFLWFLHRYARDPYSLNYERSFVTTDDDNLIFKKDGKDITISIKPTAILPYNIFKYYRYSPEGWLNFSFEQDSLENEAIIKNATSGKEYIIKPLYSGFCNVSKVQSENEETANIKFIGLQIGESKIDISPSEVSCFMEDIINSPWSGPFLAFQEFDEDYSTLKLLLPNGKSVLIDVETKEIIHSKQLYSEPCNSGPKQFTLTTPSSTTVLFENVWSDPVLHSAAGSDPNVCLSKITTRDEAKPTFSLDVNYGEGSAPLGTFELNLQTHKFKKLK